MDDMDEEDLPSAAPCPELTAHPMNWRSFHAGPPAAVPEPLHSWITAHGQKAWADWLKLLSRNRRTH